MNILGRWLHVLVGKMPSKVGFSPRSSLTTGAIILFDLKQSQK